MMETFYISFFTAYSSLLPETMVAVAGVMIMLVIISVFALVVLSREKKDHD